METVKTASGKIFDCEYLSMIPNPQRVYIRVKNKTFLEVATVFSNPNETIQLWYEDLYISGFSRLVSISPEDDTILVSLAKE